MYFVLGGVVFCFFISLANGPRNSLRAQREFSLPVRADYVIPKQPPCGRGISIILHSAFCILNSALFRIVLTGNRRGRGSDFSSRVYKVAWAWGAPFCARRSLRSPRGALAAGVGSPQPKHAIVALATTTRLRPWHAIVALATLAALARHSHFSGVDSLAALARHSRLSDDGDSRNFPLHKSLASA